MSDACENNIYVKLCKFGSRGVGNLNIAKTNIKIQASLKRDLNFIQLDIQQDSFAWKKWLLSLYETAFPAYIDNQAIVDFLFRYIPHRNSTDFPGGSPFFYKNKFFNIL